MTETVVLETPRLILREFSDDDAPAIHPRIWATCDVRNVASARVLEKLGMKREGHIRHAARRKGEWRDSYLYAIIEPEWDGRSQPTG